MLYPANENVRQSLALAVADMIKPLGIKWTLQAKAGTKSTAKCTAAPSCSAGGSHDPLEIYNLYSAKMAGIDYYSTGYYPTTPPLPNTWTKPNKPTASKNHSPTGKTPCGTAKQALV